MEEVLNILKDVKLIIDSSVVLVEHPGDGADKKKKVVKIVNEFIKTNNITIPIPIMIFNYILDSAIDWIVEWLNDNAWKKDNQKQPE